METTRTYILPYDSSAQSVAYALAEYLDVEKNMITQTMRTRNGYTVQCKGDATAEWTKYIGMDSPSSSVRTNGWKSSALRPSARSSSSRC